MKFGLKGSVMLQPLETHLRLLEGNEIVGIGEAEFVVTDNPTIDSRCSPVDEGRECVIVGYNEGPGV